MNPDKEPLMDASKSCRQKNLERHVTKMSDKQLACKEKAVSDVTKFAASKQDELKKLINEFEEKWQFGLISDSKVPEEKKSFFNFLSLKASNREEVIMEIKKYLELYRELQNKIESIKANNERSVRDAFLHIKDLYDRLSVVVERAKIEQETTDSKAVYNLHRDIIVKEEKIVSKIEKVELSVSRQQLIGLTGKLEVAVKACEETKEQISTLQQENKEFKDECKRLVEENRKLAEKCDTVLVDNMQLRKELRGFLQQIAFYVNRKAENEKANDNPESSTIEQELCGLCKISQQKELDAHAAENLPSGKSCEVQAETSSRPASPSGSDGSDIEVISISNY